VPSPESGKDFIPGLAKGDLYKYHIESRYNGYQVDKADPLAFYAEVPPRTASRVWNLDFEWTGPEMDDPEASQELSKFSQFRFMKYISDPGGGCRRKETVH
jgi:1,4-alpha-glucan branching enzyme